MRFQWRSSILLVCLLPLYLLFHLDSLMNEILQRGIVVQLYNVLDLPIETMQIPCHAQPSCPTQDTLSDQSPFKSTDLHLYSINPFLSLPISISSMTSSLPIHLISPSCPILFIPVIFSMRIIRWSYLSSYFSLYFQLYITHHMSFSLFSFTFFFFPLLFFVILHKVQNEMYLHNYLN